MTTVYPVTLMEYPCVAGDLIDLYEVRQDRLPDNMIPVGLDIERNAILFRHSDRDGVVVATTPHSMPISRRLKLSERPRCLPLPYADLRWACDSDGEQKARYRELQDEAEVLMQRLSGELDEGDFIEVVCCLQCALKCSHSIREIERELSAVAAVAKAIETSEESA